MKSIPVLVLFIVCVLTFPVTAATIRVPADQPTIQAAIDVAVTEDIVLVADGVYIGEGNRDIDFLGKAITVRSENGPESCIIDCQGSEADPHRGFFFHDRESRAAVLEGFTIRNGYNSPSGSWGGAIACQNHAQPTIRNNILTGSYATYGGAISCFYHAAPLITGNRIENNQAYEGGGIYGSNDDVSPVITDNLISGNTSTSYGGGVRIFRANATISGNVITENESDTHSGGISCVSCDDVIIIGNLVSGNWAGESGVGGMIALGDHLLVSDNVIVDNETEGGVGGVAFGSTIGDGSQFINNLVAGNRAALACGGAAFSRGSATVWNNTIAGNESGEAPGAVRVTGGEFVFENNIIWENVSPEGHEILLDLSWTGTISIVHMSYTDISGGKDAVQVVQGCILDWGEGMIDADPLFITGPDGDHYLSQTIAGQPDESPCVDAGSDLANEIRYMAVNGPVFLSELATRTDRANDLGIVDMGYHYPGADNRLLVAGPGPAENNPPLVRVFPAESGAPHLMEWGAYSADSYGVNVTCGDLDGDETHEIITGAGPGAIYGPHVRGFTVWGDPVDGLNFLAYGTNKYGVNVAAGDLDGDGFDEIITGAGPGAVFGPHVRGWIYESASGVIPYPGVSYFAYGTPKWGVNVTAGDIDGDGYDEVVTGPGPGTVYGPHVRGWNVDGNQSATPIPEVSYFAYNTLKYGVNVTTGDVDGDGIAEIVTGAGPGAVFGPHVRGWNYDGDAVTPLPDFSLFAWLTGSQSYGVNVYAGVDLNGDGLDDVIAGRGPDPEADTEVKVFSYLQGKVVEWMAIDAFGGMTHGTNVAAGLF